MKKIYITTAIDYTNDVVHLGHAYQKVIADCLARYYGQKQGIDTVYFVTGTDEHGGNIERIAKEKGKDPKTYVDEIVAENKKQWKALDIDWETHGRFIRTTDEDHKETVIEFWNLCKKNGDLEKRTFKGLYCFGCEAYKTDSEIIDGKCPLHITKQLEEIEEENWFFLWSKHAKYLKEILTDNFVIPSQRLHEMQSFLARGLQDIPVSRPKEKISWGISVPDDPSQVIYVWFDALINYYTAAIKEGFWDNNTEITHILGKDNTRWHALLWPAMLRSADIRLPNKVYSHGFINLNGQKISKSLGNVIRPTELVEKFGTDAVRYYLLRFGPAQDDVDISIEKLTDVYNADLANGLGNLASRVAALAHKYQLQIEHDQRKENQLLIDTGLLIENFAFDEALKLIWIAIRNLDKYINNEEPWKQTPDKAKQTLQQIIKGAEGVNSLIDIGEALQPLLPQTAQKMLSQFGGAHVELAEGYFPRI